MRTFTLLLAALLLAACSTPQERAAQMQAEMERDIVVYGPACARLGFQVNSDTWRSCILQLATKEEMQRYGYPSYYAGYGRGYWHGGGYWGPPW